MADKKTTPIDQNGDITHQVLEKFGCYDPWDKRTESDPILGFLLMTVGLPRSGKSTWATLQGYPIVNPDSIRLALHGQPFISSAEPFVWAIAKCMVNSLFLAGHQRVILDATNTTRQRRDEWKSDKWHRDLIQFLGPEERETCIKRAHESDFSDEHKAGLIAAINKMADNWEPIETDETGPGDIYYLARIVRK